MVTVLLIVGLAVAAFVGYNIGGSSTGVAFGPAVGSRITSKTTAGVLFTAFALLGGWTVGREVIETMGGEIVPANEFTLAASVVVLFFTGLSLLISNLFGVAFVGISVSSGCTGITRLLRGVVRGREKRRGRASRTGSQTGY